jgi:hypothetical protein
MLRAKDKDLAPLSPLAPHKPQNPFGERYKGCGAFNNPSTVRE